MRARTRPLRWSLVAWLSLALPSVAGAWGLTGHHIIATIAANRLTPSAQSGVAALLGRESLVGVSTFADDVRSARPETRGWNFVDIPRAESNYVPARDCPQRNCIIEKVEAFWATLANPAASRGDRAEALKFLAQLVGDLHQPLHVCGDNRGQNAVRVNFFGRQTSIHAVWDSDIIVRRGGSVTDYAAALEALASFRDRAVLERGTVLGWALDAHRIADERAYVVPADSMQGDAYYQANRQALEDQLLLAGVRLARVLNDAFEGRGPPAVNAVVAGASAARAAPTTGERTNSAASTAASRTSAPASLPGRPPAASGLQPGSPAVALGFALLVAATAGVVAGVVAYRRAAAARRREAAAPPYDAASLPAAYEGPEPYIFVSYKREDAAQVRPLLARLGQLGYRVWYDKGIPGGAEWDAVIERRIIACAGLLFVLSRRSGASKHCRREVKFAEKRDRRILSVRTEPVDLGDGLDMLLGPYQIIDIGDADFDAELARALVYLVATA